MKLSPFFFYEILMHATTGMKLEDTRCKGTDTVYKAPRVDALIETEGGRVAWGLSEGERSGCSRVPSLTLG